MRPIRLLLPIAALLLAFPAAVGATWAGKPGRIAYYALSDDGDGVYTIRPNGTGNHRIIKAADGDIAWSRDGKRIAFFRTNDDLWQARSDGSHAHRILRLTGGAYGADVAWAPSGRRLVFTLSTEREVGDEENVVTTNNVYVVHRDGTHLRKLRKHAHDPTWSSRNLIAYATERGNLVTVKPNGHGRHIWVAQGSPMYVSDLDFSPNGLRLLYQQSTPSITKNTIRTISLRSGRKTRFRDLTKEVNAMDVAWAPGGRRVAYLHSPRVKSGPAPPDEVRTIRPTGTHRKTLFKLPAAATAFDFAWQTR